ncbi:MAG: HutD family protein [Pseudorhodobacter sp.]
MIRHLTQADFRTMPWANGKGVTVEMAREDRGGAMLWRLSRASVVENGEFSVFPGVERNLTVLTGPGFDLVGRGVHLRADPLRPVPFAGDIPIRAEGVAAPCDDFNVMTARHIPHPEVRVAASGSVDAAGGIAGLYALAAGLVNGRAIAVGDLVLSDGALDWRMDGPAIAVLIQFASVP